MNYALNGETTSVLLHQGLDCIAADGLSSFDAVDVAQAGWDQLPKLGITVTAFDPESVDEELTAMVSVERATRYFTDDPVVLSIHSPAPTNYSSSAVLADGTAVRISASDAGGFAPGRGENRSPGSEMFDQARNIAEYVARLPGLMTGCRLVFTEPEAVGHLILLTDALADVALARRGVAVEQDELVGSGALARRYINGMLSQPGGRVELLFPGIRVLG